MANEDAPDLETLVEDSRNPHAIRQYIEREFAAGYTK